MQPWSPDDLLAEASAVAGAATADPASAFAPLPGAGEVEAQDRDFVEDHPRDGLAAFMARLEPEERVALYQLVESELREEIQTELAATNEQWRAERDQLLSNLADELKRRMEEGLEEIGRGVVEVAIAMAEQILRTTLSVDREALLRALETLVFRAPRGTRFSMLVHPEDAAFLEDYRETLNTLGIDEVHADRRITPGGCTVAAEGQEWDFTVEGRLEKVAAVVREILLAETEDGEQ